MEAAADPQPWSLPEAPLGLSVLPSWVEPHIYWGHCSEMMRHGRTRHLVYQNSAFLHPKPQGAPRRGGCCSGQGLGSLNILCSRYGRRCSVHAVRLQIETRVSWVTRGPRHRHSVHLLLSLGKLMLVCAGWQFYGRVSHSVVSDSLQFHEL